MCLNHKTIGGIVDHILQNSNLHTQIAAINFKGNGSSVASQQKLDTRKVVNVIIAKDFNLASEGIQIQMLEVPPFSPQSMLLTPFITKLIPAHSE